MKTGDFYRHFKGNEYYFKYIALPLEGRKNLKKIGVARYHENDRDLNLYKSYDGVIFIDSDFPHVIYQDEKHYNTDFTWCREVDNFFGYKFDKETETFVKRFSRMS